MPLNDPPTVIEPEPAQALSEAYEDAWAEWDSAGEAEVWESTALDGLVERR
jgi:hypothetical protein